MSNADGFVAIALVLSYFLVAVMIATFFVALLIRLGVIKVEG